MYTMISLAQIVIVVLHIKYIVYVYFELKYDDD